MFLQQAKIESRNRARNRQEDRPRRSLPPWSTLDETESAALRRRRHTQSLGNREPEPLARDVALVEDASRIRVNPGHYGQN